MKPCMKILLLALGMKLLLQSQGAAGQPPASGPDGAVVGQESNGAQQPSSNATIEDKNKNPDGGLDGQNNNTQQNNGSENNPEISTTGPGAILVKPEDITTCGSLSTSNPTVQQTIVDYHNNIRSNVTPPASRMKRLRWSKELMESAKQWAEKCTCGHSPNAYRIHNDTAYGENVMISDSCTTWDSAIEAWHNESKNLIFGVGPNGKGETGHYTQLVNSEAEHVGCSAALCRNETVDFKVCFYNPGGNDGETLYTPYSPGEPCSGCKDCDPDTKLCNDSCPYRESHCDCEKALVGNLCATDWVNANCSVTCRCDKGTYVPLKCGKV
ncbi:cysteine-rich secretory protein 2-like [Gastrophryne carolinensis]